MKKLYIIILVCSVLLFNSFIGQALPDFIEKHFVTSRGTPPDCIDVSMVINKTEVFRSDNIEIEYIITNNGPKTLSSIEIELELLHYFNIIKTSNNVDMQRDGKLSIREGPFHRKESKNISFIASVDSNAPVGESTVHKPNSFEITYPDGRNTGSQKFSRLEIKNNPPNITSAYIDIVLIDETIETDLINLLYNNTLYMLNGSVVFNLICNGYDTETPINELKYIWIINNHTLTVDSPNHKLDMANYFPPGNYQSDNLFKVRVMDSDRLYSPEFHPKFRGTNGEIIKIDYLSINDYEYYRKNISNLIKIIFFIFAIYFFPRFFYSKFKLAFISKCNNIADSIDNTLIRKLLKSFRSLLVNISNINSPLNLGAIIILIGLIGLIIIYIFLYVNVNFYVIDFYVIDYDHPLINFFRVTGPIDFRSLSFFQFYVYLIVFILIVYFTERRFDKSTSFSLYHVNSFGMAVTAWFSVTLLSDLIQLNPDHLHWYYSTSAQVFATILAIVAMWGASINKGLMGYKTSANLVILPFTLLYCLIVFISLVGLSIGTSANFSLYKVDISFDSDSIIILLPIAILQISLLLITPAISCLYELVDIILKENNQKINNQNISIRGKSSGFGYKLKQKPKPFTYIVPRSRRSKRSQRPSSTSSEPRQKP
ncbi:COG1361 family protein [Candidatus Methanocrinis natronophilus]|uniref:Uncharacterized protein n=1 Tax=Candidatus Methanocrinis natronophilus TaxID=3033396 RepID=A0ABT5XAE5_9EURY|nr:hypothetical protein [Candidatus Methanocrinis natronophilus]MDF0591632.1 hypothetical protein [Candidatus Methanocrinis natronophilus]